MICFTPFKKYLLDMPSKILLRYRDWESSDIRLKQYSIDQTKLYRFVQTMSQTRGINPNDDIDIQFVLHSSEFTICRFVLPRANFLTTGQYALQPYFYYFFVTRSVQVLKLN